MSDPDDDTTRPEFSVCVFSVDGTHHYECRFEHGRKAVETFIRICEKSGAAQIGLYTRVIVTDGGDNTNMEWKFGEGYTFPPELVERNKP